MAEIRLLGPLEVSDGGRAIEIRRQKQRALLVALALDAGRVVSRDRLVDRLWGDEATAGAGHTLENYVSQLRKLLGETAIRTRAPGYVLDVEPEQVDALRFERLLREGRPEEALALVRGEPLADVAAEPFAAAEIARLDELVLAAREQLVELRLGQGRHTEVIPELERLVAANPYRERLRGLLMLALYGAGRQADALAAYRDAREALVEGLGIEPGAELQELERAILQQDPSLRTSIRVAAPPRERPSRKTVTVLYALLPEDRRRDPESSDPRHHGARAVIERNGGRVEHAFADAVVAVFGVPAVREDDAARAVEAARELHARVGVATGEVFVPGGAQPVAGEPLAVAEQLARAAQAGEVRLAETTRRLAGGRGLRLDSPLVGRSRELDALTDAFAAAVDAGACQLVTLVGPAGIGKSRLIAEAVSRLGDEAAVLVLDDAHATLEDEIDRLRQAPSLILCAARPDQAAPASTRVDSRTIVLEPLGEDESELLMDNLLGSADLPPLVRSYIVGAAEGNPLFLEEFLASLIDRDVLRLEGGTWTTQELPALGVPPTIQALLAARIDRLPEDERRVLELASVEGRRFHAETVSGLAPAELRSGVPALLTLLARRDLIEPEDDGFSFRHQLLRDAAYESIPKRTRAELHEQLGDGEAAASLLAELDGVSAA